jgi:hypothetical protein
MPRTWRDNVFLDLKKKILIAEPFLQTGLNVET